MSPNDLYSLKMIKQEFNQPKLFELLAEETFYNIEKSNVKIKKNSIIALCQDNIEYVYYICDGIASISIADEVFEFKGPSEFIGLSDSAIDTSCEDFQVKTITEMTFWRFTKSEVIAKIMSTQEGYLYHYMSMLDQYSLFTKKLMTMKKTHKERVFIALQELAKKFGTPYNNAVKIPSVFTRNIIAEYVGIGLSKLSDSLLKLQEESLITVTSKREIILEIESIK
ncbi:Crp/Fnr family transcriptional regulator [Listeria booriae]|uniref:Crp/Fnr family transcriptional regulator n=1 Tax=Listeria booriae TaxID=1552123 RepID=UPI0016247CFB|nr:Crp/Fnr family transcriptional regulator [Listeria booriae]MBC2320356.1 Crp/Fnr family transcriptional regulator [Listeria booriae]